MDSDGLATIRVTDNTIIVTTTRSWYRDEWEHSRSLTVSRALSSERCRTGTYLLRQISQYAIGRCGIARDLRCGERRLTSIMFVQRKHMSAQRMGIYLYHLDLPLSPDGG